MSQTKYERRDDFMQFMRPYKAHWITAALDKLTPGISWSKCSKGHMADEYANGILRDRGVDLLQLVDLLEERRKTEEAKNG